MNQVVYVKGANKKEAIDAIEAAKAASHPSSPVNAISSLSRFSGVRDMIIASFQNYETKMTILTVTTL
jgi:hypothetical protein